MVKLRMRKREMRGYEGNYHENLELKRILCASQFTISNMAGMGPHPVYNNTDMRSSQPNQASDTPGYSYPLISTILFSSSSPISLFLVQDSIIIGDYRVKWSLSISPSHDDKSRLCTEYTKYSIHRVLHTVSTAYSKYSIQQVQHTASTAYTEYSIHQVKHKLSTVYPEYSIHWVKNTLSLAYIECSIHRVQLTPCTASTQKCLSFLHSISKM